MCSVSSDRGKGAVESTRGPSGAMPHVRASGHSEASDDVSAHVIELRGCKPENPLNGSQGRSRAGNLYRAKKRKSLRERTYLEVCAALGPEIRRRGRGQLTVTITRISPRPFDSDGWQAAAKPIRDGVADAFSVHDNVTWISWVYHQVKGRAKEYSVRVVIESTQ
jgi:hypothetical protein